MRDPRRPLLFALLTLMVIVGLPVADIHQGHDAGAAVSGGLVAEPAHDEHAMPIGEGDHVHLHHCCPHAVSTSYLAVNAPYPHGTFGPVASSGDLLPGIPTLPFRPPAA